MLCMYKYLKAYTHILRDTGSFFFIFVSVRHLLSILLILRFLSITVPQFFMARIISALKIWQKYAQILGAV